MEFTNEELLYIHNAVLQDNAEYGFPPGDLVQRLEAWKRNMQEICSHPRKTRRNGFLMRDNRYSWVEECTDCGVRLGESVHA